MIATKEQKKRARAQMSRAIKRGDLVRAAACEDCGALPGNRNLHGHHEDYEKPLSVKWLCVACHGNRHARPHPRECTIPTSLFAPRWAVEQVRSIAKERGETAGSVWIQAMEEYLDANEVLA